MKFIPFFKQTFIPEQIDDYKLPVSVSILKFFGKIIYVEKINKIENNSEFKNLI